jgi:hypothetical protein
MERTGTKRQTTALGCLILIYLSSGCFVSRDALNPGDSSDADIIDNINSQENSIHKADGSVDDRTVRIDQEISDRSVDREENEIDCKGDLDCEGVCKGNAVEDETGSCCRPKELDCADICNGPGVVNDGGCCASGVLDCQGVCEGSAVEDETGDCCEPVKLDCADICNGPGVVNDGGCCASGVLDCQGVCDGHAVEDKTGDCCEPEELDCAENCNGPGLTVEDSCCETGVVDCLGVCEGSAIKDINGECCQEKQIDCSGACNDSDREESDLCCDSQYPAELEYPPRYSAPDEAQIQFDTMAHSFLETTAGGYEVVGTPITWTPVIRPRGSKYLILAEEELTTETAPSVVEQFLYSEWSEFFKIKEVTLLPSGALCSGNVCNVAFKQNHCGLQIVSGDSLYDGDVNAILLNGASASLYKLYLSVVPVMPVHLLPSIELDTAKEALIGYQFGIECADGVETNEITSDWFVEFSHDLVIFVQPLADHSLEYRLAYRFDFKGAAFAYVDAVDGSPLLVTSSAICD